MTTRLEPHDAGRLDADVRVVRVFNGPSLACLRPTMHLQVPVGAEGPPLTAADMSALATRVTEVMAAIDSTTALPPVDADCAASTVQHVALLALLLQRWLGHGVSFTARGPAAAPGQGVETVILEHRFAELGLSAVRTAMDLLAAADPTPDPARVEALLRTFHRQHAGDALHHVVRSAEARGVPWRRPVAGLAFFELGQGVKQQRVWRNFTPATSHLGTVIATRKHLASALFRSHGLPAPQNIVVGNAEAAVRAARALGLPVVVKPERTDFGTAVSVNLSHDDAIGRAFRAARVHGPVLVEQMVAGDNHRLLVMHGRFVSAVQQTPAQVVGDGVHTVRALVERTNRTRTEGLSHQWKKITLDEQVQLVLDDQGLRLDDVPAAARTVRLRTASNLSVGGTMQNVTTRVHADNQALAVRAAAVAGLDVAGIDFITTDISRSHHEVGGAICEINPTPGFTMGEAAGVLEQLFFDGLFAPGSDGRVATVVVLASDPPDPWTVDLLSALEGLLSDRLSHELQRSGPPGAMPVVGVAARGQARVGADVIATGPDTTAQAFAQVLADPRVGAALLALSVAAVVDHGLPLDRCSVVIITGADAARHVTGPAARQRQAVLRLLGRVAGAVVIAADDPHRSEVEAGPKLHVVPGVGADGAAGIDTVLSAAATALDR